MKHISKFLAVRERQLVRDRHHAQLSLFGSPREKGSAEWSVFNAVRNDSTSFYRVRTPQKPIVVRESGPAHILRIVYPFRAFRSVH